MASEESTVYYIRVSEADSIQDIRGKTVLLLEKSALLDFIPAGSSVPVKLHFGEEGNAGHVRPEYAAAICSEVARRGASPFLSDTNALYRGMRTTSRDHAVIARQHGFARDLCGFDVVIPDDTKASTADIDVGGRCIKKAKIATTFTGADALIGVAHFKGHLLTGFGGALKNIGMGCATREGKLAQHSSIAPIVVLKRCVACMECIRACPADAITIRNRKAFIDGSRCIGCASCIAACIQEAIQVDWESGGNDIQEKMVEYAKAVLQGLRERVAFVNFAIKITKECDCLALDDPRIAPDIGIFASRDPVSVDTACYDRVLEMSGSDVFKAAHPKRDGMKQLRYASELGLGTMKYRLVHI